MTIGFIGKGRIGMAQDAGQGGDVRAVLHPVRGEGMPQGVDAPALDACLFAYGAEGAGDVVSVRRMSDHAAEKRKPSCVRIMLRDSMTQGGFFISTPRLAFPAREIRMRLLRKIGRKR